MSGLKDKLNTLVRARIRGVLGSDPDRSPARRKPPLDKRADKDVAALRRQIDAALDDEDRMAAEIQALAGQVADRDQQADRALAAGDEAAARHALHQMQQDQKRLAMLEADLAAHRLSIAELISQVNTMEAAVAEAHRQQAMPEQAAKPAPDEAAPAAQPARPPAGDDDLALRRARLSQKE